MPHLSHQRCWVGPEYWQVSITKSHWNELENLAWGSRYADLTATDTRKAGIPPSKENPNQNLNLQVKWKASQSCINYFVIKQEL